MAFIQIIEVKTTKFSDIQEVDRQWYQATEGKRKLQRSIITKDRSDPSRYLILAFFDSYESAMENSALPETEQFAGRLAGLVDEPMAFQDLDVVEERS
jgi:hypothetical protein